MFIKSLLNSFSIITWFAYGKLKEYIFFLKVKFSLILKCLNKILNSELYMFIVQYSVQMIRSHREILAVFVDTSE